MLQVSQKVSIKSWHTEGFFPLCIWLEKWKVMHQFSGIIIDDEWLMEFACLASTAAKSMMIAMPKVEIVAMDTAVMTSTSRNFRICPV